MVQTPIPPTEVDRIDLETFLQQPETKPASEFINSVILQKPMPKGKHSILQGELVSTLNATFKPNKSARAFPELRCVFGGRAIVPDISVFQINHIPRDANGEIANLFELPPDWMIEILSPDQDAKNIITKMLHSLDCGCEMGWMIDPEEHTVMTYPHNDRSRCFSQPDAILPVPTWATSFQLSIGELFSWLSL